MIDNSSKQRMRERVYSQETSVERWSNIASNVIHHNSGKPESYDYLINAVKDAAGAEVFTLPAPSIAKKEGLNHKNVRKHIDNLCNWGLLEAQGMNNGCLEYVLVVPVRYRKGAAA